jgi:hypothetical protein
MIELRFHREFYDGFAVDEAVKVYSPYASMELAREPEGFVVRVTAAGLDLGDSQTANAAASQGINEQTLAAEMANYALGLSVERNAAPEAEPAP